MSITDALIATSFDLLAAPYSGVTNIQSDYIFDHVELNFTTSQSKTVTATSSKGTVIYSDTNTLTSMFIGGMDLGFKSGENITVTVTQTAGACSMNLVLRVRKGLAPLATSISNSNDTQYANDGTYEYFGAATPGSLTSASSWKIFRIKLGGYAISFANGSASFDKVWNNYSSFTYTN